MNCFLNSIPIADDRVLSSDGGWELYREYDRNEFLKSIENKKPYIVSYDKEHDAWYIEGTLPKYYVGGVPNIIIRGEDGRVLALWHTK